MKPFFSRLYEYNFWRHNTLYTRIKQVEVYEKNLEKEFTGLYFSSIKGTLNHLLLADILWLNRISKLKEIKLNVNDQIIKANDLSHLWNEDLNKSNKLFLTYFENIEINGEWFNSHIQRYTSVNTLFKHFIENSQESDFIKDISYLDTSNNKTNKILNDCLFHIINHHTHHIGQISNILCELSKSDHPSLDYTIKF